MHYPDQFLAALGGWKRGWCEDGDVREQRLAALIDAVGELEQLPREARQITERCYRRRFLVPNNPQNGADFLPLVFNGRIEEGIASWTTDYAFAKEFKAKLRPGEIAAVFGYLPKNEDVFLNIQALWGRTDFAKAAADYVARKAANSEAYVKIGPSQSEVILSAPLLAAELEGFWWRSSDFDTLADAISLSETERSAAWQHLVENDAIPNQHPYWLSREPALAAFGRIKEIFLAKNRE